jgi:hypothetical protein
MIQNSRAKQLLANISKYFSSQLDPALDWEKLKLPENFLLGRRPLSNMEG